MAGSAGEVFGSTRVKARVTPLGRRDGQGSVGKDVRVSAVYHRPPLLVPSDLRLGLPVGHALQTDRLAQYCGVLHPRHAQHGGHWET